MARGAARRDKKIPKSENSARIIAETIGAPAANPEVPNYQRSVT
jgi:hypothetical protein